MVSTGLFFRQGGATYLAALWLCMSGRGPEGAMPLAWLSPPAFSHCFCYPQASWTFLVLIPWWVGVCMFWDPVGLSNELSCEAESLSCCPNPHRCFFFLFFFRKILFLEREGKERGRETSTCGCLLSALHWGPGPQPRPVPCLGIQPTTLWFAGWCSVH